MFVKIFKEEKEQTIFFLLDVSASQEIGLQNKQKIDIARDICGVLALSAIKESGQVGLICFSDKKEKYLKPGKGMKHGYEFLVNLFNLIPTSFKTNLNAAIHFALDRIKRKSVVILISDFIDENYEHSLVALAKKHDLVVIDLVDKREILLPNMGIVPLFQIESKKTMWINSSSETFKKLLQKNNTAKTIKLEKLCRQHNANYLSVNTDEDFVPKLLRLFKVRNSRNKR